MSNGGRSRGKDAGQRLRDRNSASATLKKWCEECGEEEVLGGQEVESSQIHLAYEK